MALHLPACVLRCSVLVLVIAAGQTQKFDYCSVTCNNGKGPPDKHTMCVYPKEEPGPQCSAYQEDKLLTREDKVGLLELHNTLRSDIALGKHNQPKAANMMEMVWSEELETIARRWAFQCDYEHDKCRKTHDGVHCGQNLAVSYRGGKFFNEWRPLVNAWFGELKGVPEDMIRKFRGLRAEDCTGCQVGHYTQMVWGKSSAMGCERVFFHFSDWGMTEFLVCVYLHGNMLGESIYQIGETCSGCPDQEKCGTRYPGLCDVESFIPGQVTEKPETGPDDYDEYDEKPKWIGGGLYIHHYRAGEDYSPERSSSDAERARVISTRLFLVCLTLHARRFPRKSTQ